MDGATAENAPKEELEAETRKVKGLTIDVSQKAPRLEDEPGSPGITSPTRKRTPADFEFGDVLGEGSYSTVMLAKEKRTGRHFAIKILDKKHIMKEKKIKYVDIEKKVFQRLGNHPYFVRLYYTFQDPAKLYFVLSYAEHGEMLNFIKKVGVFEPKCAQFYIAELVLALEYLHNCDIIHRDVKPENILMSSAMHIRLTDFGTAKIIDSTDESSAKANSFVGTAEYVSPELLRDKSACKASDLWAVGCILYQLLAGRPPFHAANEYQIFQRITKLEYKIPDGFPSDARDLVEQLLKMDPKERLGSEEKGGYEKLKEHPFFSGIVWKDLHLQTPPDITPYLPMGCESGEGLRATVNMPLDIKGSSGNLLAAGEEEKTLVQPPPMDEGRKAALAKQATESVWAPLLTGSELIVHTSLVNKRKGLFSKKRQLILTDQPRLLYIDPDKMVVKGQIPWNETTKPEFKNTRHFFVHTPNRTYYLEDLKGGAKEWVDVLNEHVAKLIAAAAQHK
eukprot:Colp12_sorted_trinity150504_noHs@10578